MSALAFPVAFEKRSMSAGSPFHRIPSWRKGRSRTLVFSLWILVSFLDRVSFHTSLLESADLLLSIVRNLHCFLFLCLWTCPGLQGRQRRAFSSCRSNGRIGRVRKTSKLVVRHLEQKTREKHFFSSEEHLERTESSVASADLTLETDGKNNIQHFLVGVILYRNVGFSSIAY